jgi:hypothetical protein
MRRGTFESRAESRAYAAGSATIAGDCEYCAAHRNGWAWRDATIQRHGEQHDERERDLEREWGDGW